MNSDYIEEWPADGIEDVASCPVCGSKDRYLLHCHLTDQLPFGAPGKWTLYRCLSCASGYLNPRPTPAAMPLAYKTYYTHNRGIREAPSDLGLTRRLMRGLANGYRNWRFGTHYQEAIYFGRHILRFMPAARLQLDRQMRYLPKMPADGRLLDLGFGSGAFLELAREGGWRVAGADMDPVVVEAARARGLDVRLGGIETFYEEPGSFDAITFSHVIEHVHYPSEVMRAAYRLLKPNGTLWIVTPNLNGPVHERFGEYWRGLEPPRHIVIFDRRAIIGCVMSAGFTDVIDLPYAPIIEIRFLDSLAVIERKEVQVMDDNDRKMIKKLERAARRDPSKRDDIMIRCRKPG